MLIFSRRVGEAFTVGDSVTVTVLDVRNGRVRISIDAPKDTPINREELLQKLTEEKPSPSAEG